jgi:putative tricarboxylic transport membrane protein
MMMLFNKNIAFFFLIFAFSVAYFATALNLGSPISNNRVEPSFFPLLLGFFAVLFSSILLFKEISSSKNKDINIPDAESKATEGEKRKTNYAPLLIMLSIFLYILAFSFIGYFISSFLFVLSIIVIFSSLEKIIQKSIISIIIVLVGYLVFDRLFGVRLPTLWG